MISTPLRRGLQPILIVTLIGIVLLLVLIYLPAIHGPFVFDDLSNVPQTNRPLNSLSDLITVALSNSSGPLGRPIPVASFALNHHFWGPDSTSFKITNLLIHLMNTVLVFFLAKTLLLLTKTTGMNTGTLGSGWVALATSILWAIHPLQVSTVMYVVQRMTLLMTFFTLSTMLLYVTARWRHLDRKPGAIFALVGAAVCAVLACFSKENGALLPLYLLVLELSVFRFRMQTKSQTTVFRNSFITATFAGSVGITAYLLMTPEFIAGGYQLREFSLPERLMTQLVVVTHYLNAFYLPVVSSMSLYQDTFPVSREFGNKELLSALVLGASALGAWYLRTRLPIVSFGILFYLTSQIMESTILPLELAFEHRNYIGTVGLSLAFVCVSYWILQRTGTTRVIYVLLPALALVLGIQTTIRVTEWKDGMTLATASVVKNPASVRARVSLASALMNAQRYAEAVHTLDDLSTTQTDHVLLQLMAFYIQSIQGVNDPERAKRIESQLQAYAVSNDTVSGLRNLADLSEQLTEGNPVKGHILRFYDIASKNSALAISTRNQAALHARHSRLLMMEGQNEQAVKAIRRAAKLNSSNREIKLRLVEALASTSSWSEVSELLVDLNDGILNGNADKTNADFQYRLKILKKRLATEQFSHSSDNDVSSRTL